VHLFYCIILFYICGHINAAYLWMPLKFVWLRRFSCIHSISEGLWKEDDLPACAALKFCALLYDLTCVHALNEGATCLLVYFVTVICRPRSSTSLCTNSSQVGECSYKLASIRPVSQAHLAAMVLRVSIWSHGRISCKEHSSKAGVVSTGVYYKSVSAAARFVLAMLLKFIVINRQFVIIFCCKAKARKRLVCVNHKMKNSRLFYPCY